MLLSLCCVRLRLGFSLVVKVDGVSEREIATVIIVEAKFRFAGDEPSNQAEKSDVCYFLLDSYFRAAPCLGPSKT